MEKISPLPCNDVNVQLYESSIMYDSKYFYCGYEGQRKGEWVILCIMIESSLGMNTMIIIVNVHVNVNKVLLCIEC